MCKESRDKGREEEREMEMHRMGEWSTEPNVPEAAVSELRGYVSGLIKCLFSSFGT